MDIPLEPVHQDAAPKPVFSLEQVVQHNFQLVAKKLEDHSALIIQLQQANTALYNRLEEMQTQGHSLHSRVSTVENKVKGEA